MHPSCYSTGVSVNAFKNSQNRLLIDVKLVETLLEVKGFPMDNHSKTKTKAGRQKSVLQNVLYLYFLSENRTL